MTMIRRMIAGGAGIAALAAAAPAAAQYAYPYGYQQYGYANQYQMTQIAAQRCSAAVQQRLSTRGSTGIGGIIGSILGVRTPTTQGRVLSITQIDPDRNRIQVRGLATSGQYAGGYGPYGVGAYGAYGYSYQPDLRFRCNVDYRGYVRDVDIDRRR